MSHFLQLCLSKAGSFLSVVLVEAAEAALASCLGQLEWWAVAGGHIPAHECQDARQVGRLPRGHQCAVAALPCRRGPELQEAALHLRAGTQPARLQVCHPLSCSRSYPSLRRQISTNHQPPPPLGQVLGKSSGAVLLLAGSPAKVREEACSASDMQACKMPNACTLHRCEG